MMRKRIFAFEAFVCLCMLMALMSFMAYAGDTVYAGRLCKHHTQHDNARGYTEGTAEIPCSHEHTEDCYTFVTNCVREHTKACYSEENGCIIKELNCNHKHDASCRYVPEKEGYKFAGWYADKKIDEVYLTEDTTVYAK